MISMNDYLGADGRVDWEWYNAAQVEAGERCRQCSGHIMFGKGFPSLCSDCRELGEDKGEVTHDSLIRCPKCGEQFDGGDACEFVCDGETEVGCPECDHQFEVVQILRVSYRSPALE